MTTPGTSTITLRAISGEPLAEDAIREMVSATAHAIAERTGVRLINLSTTRDSVTATLEAGRIEAFGFAAELRRLTTTWYTKKYEATTLWGEASHEDDDDADEDEDAGEAWKRT
jgi:hypothetical protein